MPLLQHMMKDFEALMDADQSHVADQLLNPLGIILRQYMYVNQLT